MSSLFDVAQLLLAWAAGIHMIHKKAELPRQGFIGFIRKQSCRRKDASAQLSDFESAERALPQSTAGQRVRVKVRVRGG